MLWNAFKNLAIIFTLCFFVFACGYNESDPHPVNSVLDNTWNAGGYSVTSGIGEGVLLMVSDGIGFVGLDESGFPYAYSDTGEEWILNSSNLALTNNVSLCVAASLSGQKYFASCDSSTGYRLVVRILSNSNWVPVSAPVTPGAVHDTALAVGERGVVYAAYSDPGNLSRAVVLAFSNGSWQETGGSFVSDSDATDITLAVRDNGLWITFSDWSRDGALTVRTYVNSFWETVGNPGFSSSNVESISLAVNKDGIPYVAFVDTEDPVAQNHIVVMEFRAGIWMKTGGDFVGLSASRSPVIRICGDGTPVLAWINAADEPKVSLYHSGKWNDISPSDIYFSTVVSHSLEIDGNGDPVLLLQASDGTVQMLRYQ